MGCYPGKTVRHKQNLYKDSTVDKSNKDNKNKNEKDQELQQQQLSCSEVESQTNEKGQIPQKNIEITNKIEGSISKNPKRISYSTTEGAPTAFTQQNTNDYKNHSNKQISKFYNESKQQDTLNLEETENQQQENENYIESETISRQKNDFDYCSIRDLANKLKMPRTQMELFLMKEQKNTGKKLGEIILECQMEFIKTKSVLKIEEFRKALQEEMATHIKQYTENNSTQSGLANNEEIRRERRASRSSSKKLSKKLKQMNMSSSKQSGKYQDLQNRKNSLTFINQQKQFEILENNHQYFQNIIEGEKRSQQKRHTANPSDFGVKTRKKSITSEQISKMKRNSLQPPGQQSNNDQITSAKPLSPSFFNLLQLDGNQRKSVDYLQFKIKQNEKRNQAVENLKQRQIERQYKNFQLHQLQQQQDKQEKAQQYQNQNKLF